MAQEINPTPLVKRFLADPNISHSGRALDIGFGHGRDSIMLAKAGYSVVAIDKNKETTEKFEKDAREVGIKVRCEDAREVEVKPSTHSLIVAGNVLFFIEDKEEVLRLINCFIAGLTKRGYLLFSLLGSRDEWKNRKGVSVFKHDEVLNFLKAQPIEIYFQSTEEGYGPTMAGPIKYWHLSRFIVKKI